MEYPLRCITGAQPAHTEIRRRCAGRITEAGRIHQMQGGMWVTGRKWCDFIMYVPDLASVGKDLFVKRIYRDDDFINDMVEQLMGFRANVLAMESFFRKPIAIEQFAQAA